MSLSKLFYIIATICFFVTLSLYFSHTIPLDIQNSDLGRHLLLGEIIVTSGNVPLINLLSYTNATYPFINTHWLSEVIFYLLYSVSGFNGLIIFAVILSVATFAFIFIPAIRKFGIFATIFVALLYLQVYFERTEVRPELFSMFLLAIFITILYKYREKYTRWIFALIPLELFWANLHIYFFVGIALSILFLFDVVFTKKEITSKKNQTLIWVTITTLGVTLCNPNFIKGAIYPFVVLQNYSVSIQENDNYFLAMNLYKDPSFFFFGVSVLVLWIAFFIARRKMSFVDFLFSFFFTFLGFFAVRDFTLFVIGTFIPAVKAVSVVTDHSFHKLQQKNIEYIKISILIIIFVVFLPSIISNLTIHGIGFGITDNANNAVNFLIKNRITGNIYNNFSIGNYVAYRLYPKEKVFVDARPEAYPKEFFQNIYYPMQTSLKAFNKVNEKYHFSIIFLAHTDISESQLISELSKSNEWKMIYLNNLIVIFVRNISSNQSVIRKYAINQKNVKINKDDMTDKNKVRQLANFFKIVGWDKQQLEMTLHYLQFDPKNCNAIETAAYFFQKQNSPKFQDYYNMYTKNCRQ